MRNNKQRLFEIFQKVNGIILKEEVLPKDDRESVIGDFVEFVKNEIQMDDAPEIKLSYDNKVAQEMKSFGKYTPETNELVVVAANRNLGDILRTIAHELIHHKQHKEGNLDQNSSETGSNIENEANALAGVLMRKFGAENPIIYE